MRYSKSRLNTKVSIDYYFSDADAIGNLKTVVAAAPNKPFDPLIDLAAHEQHVWLIQPCAAALFPAPALDQRKILSIAPQIPDPAERNSLDT